MNNSPTVEKAFGTLVLILCGAIFLAVLALLVSGCSTIEVRDDTTKITMKSTSIFTKSAIKSIDVKSNGDRAVRGFDNDQVESLRILSELAGTVAAGAVKGAVTP